MIRTMPLLRSLGIPFGHAATKMPRLRRCRLTTQSYSDGGHETHRWQPRWPAAGRSPVRGEIFVVWMFIRFSSPGGAT